MQRCTMMLLLLILMLVPSLAVAQEPTGSICILAFEDANANGTRDAGEVPLPGITANLAIQTDVIIQSYVTTGENVPYCFEGLAAGEYHLYFAEAPNHSATVQDNTPLTLQANQRLRIEFGAEVQSPFRDVQAASEPQEDTQLETASRVLIAALGAVFVMVFMLGFGIAIASLMF